MGTAKEETVVREVELLNKYGLHARPATLFAETANKFASDIKVSKADMVVNGKSIFGIMTLGAEKGTILKLQATGNDSEEAVRSLAELINEKFYEE